MATTERRCIVPVRGTTPDRIAASSAAAKPVGHLVAMSVSHESSSSGWVGDVRPGNRYLDFETNQTLGPGTHHDRQRHCPVGESAPPGLEEPRGATALAPSRPPGPFYPD